MAVVVFAAVAAAAAAVAVVATAAAYNFFIAYSLVYITHKVFFAPFYFTCIISNNVI